MPRATRNLLGQRFGKLEVIEFDGYKKDKKGNSKSYWICKCDCGTIKSIASIDLLRGKTSSCGCKKTDGAKRVIDVSGEKFGKLTVLEMLPSKNKKTNCRCLCDCGNEVIVNSWQLRKGKTKSCGCLKRQEGSHLEDLTDKKFGKLQPIKYIGKTNKKTRWLCRCDCGNEIIAYATNLKSGHAISCGCVVSTMNGLSTKRIYRIYKGMISRCYNKSDKRNYSKYGERGIKVCQEWQGENGLFNFIDWSYNNGYSDDLSIDRIDPNGNYEPSNCRWADNITQANNKTNNIKLTYKGITKTVPQWSREVGLSVSNIRSRIKLGWTVEQILETKVGEKRV